MSNWRMLLVSNGMNYWWYGKCAWILDGPWAGLLLTDDISIPGLVAIVWPPLVSGRDDYYIYYGVKGPGNFPYGYDVSPDRT